MLIPLRPVFYPLTLVMLIATVVWGGASRSGRSAGLSGGADGPTYETSPQAPGTQ
ncbi:hypothetical protein ABT063_24520 [Streptomyces sp. NPDC002838]|uniref:hypothetical protein n=1 Tax=Streptomyces sp. NPDC002838 TaxID=3154436 RepID=UPI00332C3F5C